VGSVGVFDGHQYLRPPLYAELLDRSLSLPRPPFFVSSSSSHASAALVTGSSHAAALVAGSSYVRLRE
jgi:hypothetical protein